MPDSPQSPETRALARRVRKLRDTHGWTSQQLANRLTALGLETTRGMVTALETGVRKSMTVDELLALARVFDISVTELLDGVGMGSGPAQPVMHLAKEIRVDRDEHGAPRITIDGQDLGLYTQGIVPRAPSLNDWGALTITIPAETITLADNWVTGIPDDRK